MAFTKIENTDLNGIGVIGLPDQPGLSAAAMQAKFEETARSVVIPKHNGLIDELEDTTAAGNIGAVAPTGRTGATVQAILDDISAFEKIESGGTTFTANGADTFKINAGSNVTITPLASPDKGIQISSAGGGGGSTGDMLMSDYDSDGSVKTAGGIKPYVTTAISGKADTSSLATVATSGSYNDLDDQPTVPTALSDLSDDATHRLVTDTDKTAWNGKSTVSWSQIITTGQKIATVSIDGTPTDVYAPTGGGGGGGSVDSVNGQTGTVVLDVDDINDVTVSGLANNDALVYDSGWKNIPLSTVALTGSYASLSGKPSLATVATSGSYTDLLNKPSIPTVTDTYSGTSSDGMSGKAVKSAIDDLDVSDSAVAGQYVSQVSETDGKISVTRASLPAVPTISVAGSGTASSSVTHQQQITIDSTPTDIDGTVYMETTATTSTSQTTAVTFSNAAITADSVIDYYCSEWNLVPDNISCASGQCVVTLPTVTTASTVTVRIYIR